MNGLKADLKLLLLFCEKKEKIVHIFTIKEEKEGSRNSDCTAKVKLK